MLTPEDIAAAHAIVPREFRDSPQFAADALRDAAGCEVVLKVETANPIGSFKGRGGAALLDAIGRDTALVCASAGNFGQGLAYVSPSVTVFSAESANPGKLDRMRALGADVRLAGGDFDAAKDAARAFAAESDAEFIEDGDHPAVSAGAGTIGLELLRDSSGEFDAVVLPVGNGALAEGVATWVRAHAPDTEIVGVVASGAPAMADSFDRREPVVSDGVDTLADGIAVRVPVPRAVAVLQNLIDRYVRISDRQILDAMQLLASRQGMLVEPAGAVGLAGIVAAREHGWKRVATVLTGANVTAEQLRTWFGR